MYLYVMCYIHIISNSFYYSYVTYQFLHHIFHTFFPFQDPRAGTPPGAPPDGRQKGPRSFPAGIFCFNA